MLTTIVYWWSESCSCLPPHNPENVLRCHISSSQYLAHTIIDMDHDNDIVLLANTPAQAETLLHSLEWAAAGISLHVNLHETEYMCFNQRGDIFSLNGSSLKLVDKFTYLGSSVSSTETGINTQLAKAWTAISHMEVRPDWWNEMQFFSQQRSYWYRCMDALHGC